MQIPMREWYSGGIWDSKEAKSDKEPPIVVPWPHIVSNTGVTVEVSESALVRALARREMAEDSEVWFAVPGLYVD